MPFAQQYQNAVGTNVVLIQIAELQKTQRFLLRANKNIQNKKERKTAVQENVSVRNYGITEVCLSITSERYQLLKFYLLFFNLMYASFVGNEDIVSKNWGVLFELPCVIIKREIDVRYV